MARSIFKVLFYVNGDKEKNDIVRTIGRVMISGIVTQLSYEQGIPKMLWDARGNRVKSKSVGVRDINLVLDNIRIQIVKYYLRMFDREAFVTVEMVSNAYQGIGSEYETLLKASGRENGVFRKRVEKDRVMATIVHGWWQETMWQRSSSLFTGEWIRSHRGLNPTLSRGL